MGDLLFAIANLSRKLGIEPEAALRKANDKFTERFTRMEQRIAASGRQMTEMSLEDLEEEWQTTKRDFRERQVASSKKATTKTRRREEFNGHRMIRLIPS